MNDGMNYQPQMVNAGFLNHQQFGYINFACNDDDLLVAP